MEADKARLEGELSEIDTAASSAAEANRIAYENAAKIQQQINERKTAQQKYSLKPRKQRVTKPTRRTKPTITLPVICRHWTRKQEA